MNHKADLPVITSMVSLHFMPLAHDEQSCNGISCAEGLICHIVIVVAGRAHSFHDCVNLFPRAILKYFSLSSYIKKAWKEKGWTQQVKNKTFKNIFFLLLFSLRSLEMIEISICFNLLPPLNIEVLTLRSSVRKVFLKIWKNSQENTCARISFFNKVTGLRCLNAAILCILLLIV